MRIARTVPRRTRRGAAAAELAFILPVLLLIVLGAIDFGRFAYSYIALTNAARAGAGLGCVNPYTPGTYSNWQTQLKQAVAEEMSQLPGFDSAQLSTTVTGVPETGGMWRVEVQATYPF